MADKKPLQPGVAWVAKGLEDMDREVARLATICSVRLLDPGVIERVLKNDASVCGSANKIAFDKLRNALMMHYAMRERAVEALGEAQTAALVKQIVEDLQKRIGQRLGGS
jgi:hypothetical protein